MSMYRVICLFKINKYSILGLYFQIYSFIIFITKMLSTTDLPSVNPF